MDHVLPPEEDTDVPAFCRALGVPGLADIHVHFLPPRLLRRVWQYFDEAGPLVGVSWLIRYKWSDAERVAHLRAMGVRMFSALAYAHRPGMAADLNAWTLAFGQGTPGCLPSATFYPEPAAARYVREALDAGARIFKVHLQVGGFAPDDPLLDVPLARDLGLSGKILLGSDFPNIPYPYARQIGGLARLGLGDDWLRAVCWDNPVALFGAPPGSGEAAGGG